MTNEEKIENASLYWYNCHQDGFPKGQEKVFVEWLKKDIQHQIIYEKTCNKINILDTKNTNK